MNFPEALHLLKQGADIRRSAWPAERLAIGVPAIVDKDTGKSDGNYALDKPYERIIEKKGKAPSERALSSLPMADILANDWERAS